jgi:hypothetical protein
MCRFSLSCGGWFFLNFFEGKRDGKYTHEIRKKEHSLSVCSTSVFAMKRCTPTKEKQAKSKESVLQSPLVLNAQIIRGRVRAYKKYRRETKRATVLSLVLLVFFFF